MHNTHCNLSPEILFMCCIQDMTYMNFGWKWTIMTEDIPDFPQPNPTNNRKHYEITTILSPWFFQVHQM